MRTLIAFAVGCAVGARAASEGYGDVKDSVKAIRASPEFHDLVDALRSHAAQTLRWLATVLEDGASRADLDPDLVERVKHLMGVQDLDPVAEGSLSGDDR